jgi:hypothetical protein
MRKFLTVLFAGLLLFGVGSAQATVLFAGSEDIDFVPAASCGGNCFTTTAGGTFRTAYARGGLENNSSSGSDPNPIRWVSPVWNSTTGTAWIHGQYYSQTTTSVSSGQWLIVYASDGNPAIIVRGTGTAGTVKISKRSVAGSFTDLVTCSATMPSNNSLQQIDLNIVYAVSGSVTLYKNSVSICTFSGDVTTDSRTLLNQFAFGALTNSVDVWSELIVADSDTRAMSLVTMEPAAAGNSNAWTGTNPCTAIVNVFTNNDASFISTTSNNVLNQCTVKFGNANTSFPSGSFTLNAVVTSLRALRGSSGPQHIEHNLRTGGVDSNTSDVTLTTSFANYYNIWATNPNGGGAWAVSDVTAAGFNIGVKSTP